MNTFIGKNQTWKRLLVFLVAAAVLSGCVTQAYSLGAARATRQAGDAAAAAQVDGLADTGNTAGEQGGSGQADISFKLKTLATAGRLAFVGEGGAIDGQVNPDLVVNPGDTVEIRVENGDGLAAHQLGIEGYNLVLPAVVQKGQETRLTFQADQEGTFAYYGTDGSAKQAGLEGRLIVGQAAKGAGPVGESAYSQTMQAGQTGQGAAVSFRLETGMADGRMVFIGRGGEIEGATNPDLVVNPGDTVEIVLVDGDGILHNISLPDFGANSADIATKGEETRISFTVDKEGAFPYFCAIPGHRQAGMEGRLVSGTVEAAQAVEAPSVARAADDLPGPLNRSTPEHVRVDLETVEVEGRLADGTSYTFWTFNGLVPGPFIRVRVGDTVEVHLKNDITSANAHSVDFHATTGPGGGAVATQTKPGEATSFTFQALNPGLYVYHCATPMVAHHITNGMYGLILVEPEGGLAPVDREFYVMQGEIYTSEPFGTPGHLTFDQQKLLDERPEYLTFNGSVGALTAEHPLTGNVGETVRIFFGVGGPNVTSSFHVIGEIFDRVYDQASLTAAPLTDVQTTLVPTGGAAMVEFALQVPGRYILVDHSLSRLERGLAGFLLVEGEAAPEVFDGQATEGSGH